MARRDIKSPPQTENFFYEKSRTIIWVGTLNSRWRNTIHLPYEHDIKQITNNYKHVWVFHKVLYRENSKMRFLWHRDNGKIDHISRLRYA